MKRPQNASVFAQRERRTLYNKSIEGRKFLGNRQPKRKVIKIAKYVNKKMGGGGAFFIVDERAFWGKMNVVWKIWERVKDLEK